MNNDIKAFIFDMDGVLLDTETICEKSWKIVASEMNLQNIEKVFYSCLGTTKVETRKIFKSFYGENFDIEHFVKRADELFHFVEETEGIDLMPHAKECLQFLKSAGFRLAIASSTRGETVRRQLQRAGLLEYFETLATGDLVKNSKPDPEIYLLACNQLGLGSHNCVAIEDSFNGVRSATNANLRTIMVPDKVQPTDEIKSLLFRQFKTLGELIEFC